ncbi:unnamed protein product [Rotaria sp. Silwood1]|nr:unnamed protein product [Rotaria sp. Silwood1]
MCVVRPAYELAIYIGLPHLRGPRNDGRFSLLKWTTLRLDTDGYAQIESLTRIIDIRQTLTVTHMKLDVNVDRSLNKKVSMTNISSSLNTISANVTSIFKTIIRTTRIKES